MGLRERVIERIEKHPESLRMGTWVRCRQPHCRTVGCLAAHIVLAEGYRLNATKINYGIPPALLKDVPQKWFIGGWGAVAAVAAWLWEKSYGERAARRLYKVFTSWPGTEYLATVTPEEVLQYLKEQRDLPISKRRRGKS